MTVNLIQVMRFITARKTKTCVRNVAVINYPGKIDEKTAETYFLL